MVWRDRYYEVGYLKRWHLAPPSAAHLTEAAAFVELSGIGPDALVLDLGCGHGRYSVGLAGAGARVVGLDASSALLRRVQSQASDVGQRASWIRGDMRALPLRSAFDLVLVVDAFGYFDSEGEDLNCLEEVQRVLKPGGRLIMRNPNAVPIRRNFRAEEVEHRKGQTITIRSILDAEGRWVDQLLRIQGEEGVEDFQRRTRIYSAPELEGLLSEAGLELVGHFAGADGASFDAEASGRIVTVCKSEGRPRDA